MSEPDYRRMVYEAIERAFALQDGCGQPMIEPDPAGGWVVEVCLQEAQVIAEVFTGHQESGGKLMLPGGWRVTIHPDFYMPTGMMRALPYAVWERRMRAEHELWARENPEAWGQKL